MLFGKRERAITRILVVEDEPLVAFENEYSLREAGYEVVATVDTLAEAVAVIEAEQLDLVMTDIALNGDGDGLDVARAAGGKNIPVLFVSGACPVDGPALGLGHLAKPYTDKMLKGALEALDSMLLGTPAQNLPAGLTLYEKT